MRDERQELAERIIWEANANKEKIISIPTMLAPQEQEMLYLLAKQYYTGAGAIFDAGICLGGCTASLARGLAARPALPDVRPIIWAYELGLADEDYVTEFIRNNFGEVRHRGDSFVDIIQKNIDAMPCREAIRFFPGDILEQPWPETIEIMFLDVCKTQAINFAMQKLFSRLIPGQSLLIQQDYVHAWHPYIHTTMGYLAHYFEPVGIALYSSFVFRLKKAIPEDVLNVDIYETAPVETLEEYLTYYYDRFSPLHKNHLEMARAFLLYEKHEYQRCYNVLQTIRHASELPWDFQYTCDYLTSHMGLERVTPAPAAPLA